MHLGAVRIDRRFRKFLPTGERRGTTCPPGEFVIGTGIDRTVGPGKSNKMVACGMPPPLAPAPAPAPTAPPPGPVITVTPTFQQAFTPQVSPVFQQLQDSPYATLSAQPIQQAATPQRSGSEGISARDLQNILAQQRQEARDAEDRRRADERAAAEQRREEQKLQIREQEVIATRRLREQETARGVEFERYQAELLKSQQADDARYADEAKAAATEQAEQQKLISESRGAVPAFPAMLTSGAAPSAPAPAPENIVNKAIIPIVAGILTVGGLIYYQRTK